MVFAIYQHGLAKGIHVSPYPEPLHASLLPHPSGLSQSTGFWCPVSCIELALVIYFTYENTHVSSYSLKSSHSLLLPPSTKVCSLHLCLLCGPACRITGTIFLSSIYICVNMQYLSFSSWHFSLCNRLQIHPPH